MLTEMSWEDRAVKRQTVDVGSSRVGVAERGRLADGKRDS
jgi:hypothetical protein